MDMSEATATDMSVLRDGKMRKMTSDILRGGGRGLRFGQKFNKSSKKHSKNDKK